MLRHALPPSADHLPDRQESPRHGAETTGREHPHIRRDPEQRAHLHDGAVRMVKSESPPLRERERLGDGREERAGRGAGSLRERAMPRRPPPVEPRQDVAGQIVGMHVEWRVPPAQRPPGSDATQRAYPDTAGVTSRSSVAIQVAAGSAGGIPAARNRDATARPTKARASERAASFRGRS